MIEKRIRDTQQIQAILGDIFVREEKVVVVEDKSTISTNASVETVFGLDELHTKLVRDIIGSTHWSRSDFEGLCDKYGLMPDGAMETINTSTFKLYDDSLIEENDGIEVNQDISKEIAL
jgi:hypothetical protein